MLCTVDKQNILFEVSNIFSSISYVNQKKSGACLINLDFFKAYDRVFLPFLLNVMKKMGFGVKFLNWIKMLHGNAKTCFLLRELSTAIDISFFICEGDPLAMLLYIIYVEPLLMYIHLPVSGLKIENFQQSEEAFCDDNDVLTDDVNDLHVIDQAV